LRWRDKLPVGQPCLALRKRNFKPDTATNVVVRALLRITALCSCVSVAVLRLPDTDKPDRGHQTACLARLLCSNTESSCSHASQALGMHASMITPYFNSNFALFFIQCFTCLHLFDNAARVRLCSRIFFADLARTSCTTPLCDRSLRTRDDDQRSIQINFKVVCVVFVRFVAVLRLPGTGEPSGRHHVALPTPLCRVCNVSLRRILIR
jgi:hypothetical protein